MVIWTSGRECVYADIPTKSKDILKHDLKIWIIQIINNWIYNFICTKIFFIARIYISLGEETVHTMSSLGFLNT